MKKMEFVTSCVGYPNDKVQDLYDMIDAAKEITYRTFCKYVDIRQVIPEFGYFIDKRQGLTLKDDWHVSYHKSFFKGEPCVYMRHSGIEHIYQ